MTAHLFQPPVLLFMGMMGSFAVALLAVSIGDAIR